MTALKIPGVRSTCVGQLACCCLALVSLVRQRNTFVRESKLGPAYCESMQTVKAPAAEIVADDGDACQIYAGELAEVSDGE